ncbi:MAG: hypothetical protein U0325_17780 [Polyangiales bacterium]
MRVLSTLGALAFALGCARDEWRYQPRDAGRDAPGDTPSDTSGLVDARAPADAPASRDAVDAPSPTRGVQQLLTAAGITFALRDDGVVFAAGLGAGSFEGVEPSHRGEFVRVPGLDGAAEISLASSSPAMVCARRTTGGVWCKRGGLDPIAVRDLDDARQIAGRCALRAGGGVACWGRSDLRATAVPVTDVVRLASFDDLHCAVRGAGTVSCWGAVGAVLDPTATARTSASPEEVPGITSAVALAVGPQHVCVALALGSVVCFGRRSGFQRGPDENVGPTVVPGASDVRALSANAGLRADGRVLVWGSGERGTRGDGTFRATAGAVLVPGVTARRLADGDSAGHVCVIAEGGAAQCWGDDEGGQLARGGGLQRWPLPVLEAPEEGGGAVLSGVVDVLHSSTAACALRRDGTVWCWGGQDHGTLGNGVRAAVPPWRLTPSMVLGLSDVTALPSGGSTLNATFGALLRDRSLRTWGIGSRGELGDGATINRASPTRVARVTDATRLIVGIQHLCAVRADETLACWGAGGSGELGDGSRTDASTPVSVAGLSGVVDVALGPDVSVALRRDGSLALWGQSRWLLPAAQTHTTPIALPPLEGATQVIAVMPHDWRQVCALQRSGRVSCLGANLPRAGAWFDMGLDDVTQIAGSPAAVGCARHGDGTVSCWGNNRNACLGDPSLPHADAYLEPQRVRMRDGALLDRVRTVRPGIGKVCAVRDDDTLWCWGAADNGVLGRGLTQWSATPRGVLGLE